LAEVLESRYLLTAGLTSQYFTSDTGAGLTGFVTGEPLVSTTVDYTSGASAFPTGLPANFSARWEGNLRPTTTGTYTFYTDVDLNSHGGNGGVYLFLAPIPSGSAAASQTIINSWASHTAEDTSATVNLTANTNYAIMMEYISYSGTPSAVLEWSATAAGISKEVIPSTNLNALDAGQGNYTAPTIYTNVPSSTPQITGAPTGWLHADIGPSNEIGAAGNTTYSSGTYSLSGTAGMMVSGPTGIPNDAAQYAFTTATGDFTFVAQITGSTDSGNSATNGLMLRTSLEPSVDMMTIATDSGLKPYSLVRWANGAASQYSNNQDVQQSADFWMEIVRYGNSVTTYYAPNNPSTNQPEPWVFQNGQTFDNLPQSVYVGMLATGRSETNSTATFDNVTITPLTRAYETSYIGDTSPGGQDHVMANVAAAYVDPSTGQSFMVGGDEDKSLSIYNNDGSFVAFGNNTHYQGGLAVAEGGNYVYYAQTPNLLGEDNGVQTYNDFGIEIRSPILGNDTITGMVYDNENSVLYVATNNMVYGFNATTLAFNGTMFEVDRAGNMAADASGNLWIIQNAGTGGSPAADVVQYSSSGTATGKTISFSGLPQTVIPRGIAVDPVNGDVYVTDIGALQDIHIYNGTTGAYISDYGYQYGIYGTGGGTTGGTAAPMKFMYPVGVGFDSAGDIYVFNTAPLAPPGSSYDTYAAGTIMQKYSSGGTLLWQNQGLEYVDTASPDPASPSDLYSDFYHYQINYNDTTPGTEATMVGTLVDPFATTTDGVNKFDGAADPRLNPPTDIANDGQAGEYKRSGVQVREIDGSKFLFDFDQHSSAINIYRFQSNSQFTVFCGELVRESDRSNQSLDGFYIWTDDSGQGTKQGGESFATGYQMDGGSHESVAWYVDSAGDIWIAGYNDSSGSLQKGNIIREYIPKAFLDAAGAPIYTNYTGTSGMYDKEWAAPASANFNTLTRAIYDPSTDALYLSGFVGTEYTPDSSAGTNLFKYDGWVNGSATLDPSWPSGGVVLPYSPLPNDTTPGNQISSLEVSGGASGDVFAAFAMDNTRGVQVYSAVNGTLVTTLASGPEIAGGSTNGPDFRNSLTVTQLSSGEYVLFNEEVEEAKITMWRWTAPEMPGLWGDRNIGTDATGTTTYSSPGAWTQSSLGGDLGDDNQTADVFNMASQLFTGDGQIVALVNSMSGTNAGSAKAGVIFRDGTAAGAVYVAIVINKTNSIELQDRTTVNGEGERIYRPGGYSVPIWVKLVRNGNTFTGYYSAGTGNPNWISIGSVTVTMSDTVQVGTAVSANGTVDSNTASFSNVALTQPLTDTDIGSPAPAGSSQFNPDSSIWTVSGGGGDIAGASDSFHFTSETYTGDGSVVARVTNQTGTTQPWAKAGVMFRNDTTATSYNAAVLVTPGNGVVFQYRNSAGTTTTAAQVSGLQAPVYVALTRSSGTLYAYYSLDGVNWTELGSVADFLVTSPQAGLAVSSHGSGVLNVATFTNVSISTATTTSQLQALAVTRSPASPAAASETAAAAPALSQNDETDGDALDQYL
jgi:hypothetical protein